MVTGHGLPGDGLDLAVPGGRARAGLALLGLTALVEALARPGAAEPPPGAGARAPRLGEEVAALARRRALVAVVVALHEAVADEPVVPEVAPALPAIVGELPRPHPHGPQAQADYQEHPHLHIHLSSTLFTSDAMTTCWAQARSCCRSNSEYKSHNNRK